MAQLDELNTGWSLWLDATPRPGWLNMAIDQRLLELADGEGTATLRLYGWAPHCLSFGRNEPALRRYDRGRIEALGVDTVRRPTGGRAVWHADELTYAVAAPVARFGSLPDAYRVVHTMLAAALAKLGVAAALAPKPGRAAGVDAGACFARPAGGELLVGGSKVVGSAQLQVGRALLQHGSIRLAGDQGLVERVSVGGGAFPVEAAEPLPPLGRGVGWADAADAVAKTARETWDGDWRPFGGADPLAAEAAARHTGFRDPAWTWRR